MFVLIVLSNTVFANIDFQQPKDSVVHFIFCSDLHFGLTKKSFRNKIDVSAAEVNEAMLQQMNKLPLLLLPTDSGVASGKKIQAIEAIVVTGDICNRQEIGIQSATASWKQFEEIYINHLQLKDKAGKKTRLLLTPGNHDISNAMGYHRPTEPLTDKASLIGIYNLMMAPAIAKNEKTFSYPNDKTHCSKEVGGIHLLFVDAWPDTAERVWMENDLQSVSTTTPVFLFTHSMPDAEARFFVNPNGNHSINEKDKFENIVTETLKDGLSVEAKTIIEQKDFANFIKKHPNIKAYFHGHSNFTEFYDWKGPEQNIDLHCFRADSPMKGKYSAKDETKLSFELVSINTITKKITVRECLWNSDPMVKEIPISWGSFMNLSLQ
jgi:hypothetical protein